MRRRPRYSRRARARARAASRLAHATLTPRPARLPLPPVAPPCSWWWRSFLTPGSSALYLFAYACVYFATKLEITGAVSTMLYFGYMGMIAWCFFLLTGGVGFASSLYFVNKIYGAIKVRPHARARPLAPAVRAHRAPDGRRPHTSLRPSAPHPPLAPAGRLSGAPRRRRPLQRRARARRVLGGTRSAAASTQECSV